MADRELREKMPRDAMRSELRKSINEGVLHPFTVARNSRGFVEFVHLGHLICRRHITAIPIHNPVPKIQKYRAGTIVWLTKTKGGRCDTWSQSERGMIERMRTEWNAAKKMLAVG